MVFQVPKSLHPNISIRSAIFAQPTDIDWWMPESSIATLHVPVFEPAASLMMALKSSYQY